MERWKFGRGQTAKEERKEIQDACAAGKSEMYLQGQRWAQMIDDETARRTSLRKSKAA